MRRRTFLATAAAGAVAPAPGLAASDAVARRARSLRAAWRERADDMLRQQLDGARLGRGPELKGEARVVADGLTGLSLARRLGREAVEDQAHPEMQALARDALDAVGAAMIAATDRVETWLAGDGGGDEGEEVLQHAVQEVAEEVPLWRTSAAERRMVGEAARDALRDRRPGALRRRARRALRRQRRLHALAVEIARDPGSTGVLTPADPRVAEHVRAGQRRHGVEAGSTEEGGYEALGAGARVLAILGLGVVFVGGAVLFLVGACEVGCGAPAFLLLCVLGLGLMALAVAGWVWLGRDRRAGEGVSPPPAVIREQRRERRAARQREQQWSQTETKRPGAVRALTRLGTYDILPDGDWHQGGAYLGPFTRLFLSARGTVRHPRFGGVGPEGADVGEALQPGVLVGEVSGETFLVGRGACPPEGLQGMLRLRVHLPPEAPSGWTGRYRITVYERSSDACPTDP